MASMRGGPQPPQRGGVEDMSFNTTTSSFNMSMLNTTLHGNGNTSHRRGGTANSSRVGGADLGGVLLSHNMAFQLDPHSTPLPAMVRVALSSFEQQSGQGQGGHKETASKVSVSCRLDPNGWAWLVSGRKLYVWRHNAGPDGMKKKGPALVPCRELLLPPSELVHHSKLVAVLHNPQLPSVPSVLAVSPEGHITFWPNISNESNTVTLNADIPGQECDSLTSIWPLGCIVTTTTATVLLVKTTAAGRGSKAGLSCAPLHVQKGWLNPFVGGYKKVTTILFAPVQSVPSLDKRARVVVPLTRDDDPLFPGNCRAKRVYIFQGSLLQGWDLSATDMNMTQCVSEVNIDEDLRRLFFQGADNSSGEGKADVRGIQTWILDVAPSAGEKNKLVLLVAAKSQYDDEGLKRGLVTFDPLNRQKEAWSFIPLHSQPVSLLQEDEEQVWRLLTTLSHYFVVSKESVVGVVHFHGQDKTDSTPQTILDIIDSATFGGPSNSANVSTCIVGCGNTSFSSVAILVPKYGLLTIRQSLQDNAFMMTAEESSFMEFRVPEHLALSMTMTENTPGERGDTDTDLVPRYKTCFLLFLQKKIEECMATLEALFPPSVPSLAPHDPLDHATLGIMEKLVDEAPAGDQRWAGGSGGGSGDCFNRGGKGDDDAPSGNKKSKILLRNFLMDKKDSLELFFGFIHQMGLLKRLEGVTTANQDEVVATSSLLYNTYEKMCFALALHQMQSNEAHLRPPLDTAIRSLIIMRGGNKSNMLSANDIFYKEVSRVYQIIPALVGILEEDLDNDLEHCDDDDFVANRITTVLEIVLRGIFNDDGTKKQFHDVLVTPYLSGRSEWQVVPWMICGGNLLNSLVRLHEIGVKIGLTDRVDPLLKQSIIKQLQQLCDIILSALKTNLLSSNNSTLKKRSFEELRSKLLRAHVELGDFEGAGLLAEKFLDFEILLSICYDRGDFEQLKSLLDKYASEGFREFTWGWYTRQGKAAEMLETFSNCGGGLRESLEEFLKDHPNIAWHHYAKVEENGKAASVLKGLALNEQKSFEDKKFLLCLSKLAGLAGARGSAAAKQKAAELVEGVDNQLYLLEYQDRMPDDVLSAFGVDGRDKMRVFSASEMIDMYTVAEVPFTASNFTSALGLSQYMVNEELALEKRVLIAYRALIRDPWGDWGSDQTVLNHPMDSISSSCLFAFVNAALRTGCWTLEQAFPLGGLEGMLRGVLEEGGGAWFLLKACHEHFATKA